MYVKFIHIFLGIFHQVFYFAKIRFFARRKNIFFLKEFFIIFVYFIQQIAWKLKRLRETFSSSENYSANLI